MQIFGGSSISQENLYLYFGYTDGKICNRGDSRFRFPTSNNIITVYHHTDGQKTRSDTTGLRIRYTVFGKWSSR